MLSVFLGQSLECNFGHRTELGGFLDFHRSVDTEPFHCLAPIHHPFVRYLGPNQVAWKNETGDPSTISLQLIPHNVSTYTPSQAFPADGVFATDIDTNTFIYTFTPACLPGFPDSGARLPTGNGFQVQFISADGTGNGTVIAISDVRLSVVTS